MENFKIEVDKKQITETINEVLKEKIRQQMNYQMDDIEETIKQYFKRSFIKDNKNQFESALNWTIEEAFRDGVSSAMEELNFKNIIAEKAKELLKNENLIHKLAEDKIKSSLGL